jgi:hypothetical protein
VEFCEFVGQVGQQNLAIAVVASNHYVYATMHVRIFVVLLVKKRLLGDRTSMCC